MSFTLLGSLAVHDRDRQAIAIPGTKARALLALLLVRANARVPTDQLEDELWDGAPPRGARSTVQAHVSRLRGVLEATGSAATLRGCAGGYEVCVDPAEIDMHRFETLARCGTEMLDDDPRHAANVLASALDEWRGPALQDVRHVAHLQLEAIRLDELRLATNEARLAAELATGGHVMAVSALQRLVEEHPYREHLRALLMLALYRSGRQVEALRSYQGARVALAEVGVEPGSELRELDERISCEDPRLRAPAPPVRIGAEERPCLVVVEGADAKALVTSATRAGSRVLRARATSKFARPYQAVADALVPLLDDAVEPELAPIVGSPASTAGVDLAYQRFRAFEAVAELLHTHAVAQPIVLMIEGIDDAGASTFDLLEHLARRAGARLTVVAVRSTTGHDREFESRVLRWERDGLAQRLQPESGTTAAAPAVPLRDEPPSPSDYADLAADAFAQAATLSARAGDDALLRLGFEEAAQHYQAALTAIDQQRAPQMLRRGELLVALGRACHAAYQLDAALDAFRRAGVCASELGDMHLLAEAAVGVATTTEFCMADDEIVDLLASAVDAHPDDSPARVELLAGLARALPRTDPAAARNVRRAVRVARELDSSRALTIALATSIHVTWGPRDVAVRLRDIEEVITRAEAMEWLELAIEARGWRAATLDQLGREREAAAERAIVASWAEQSRRPFFLALASMHAIADHLRVGALDAAEAALADLPSGAQASPNFSAGFAAQLFLLRRSQGRVHEFLPLLDMLVGDQRAPATWHAGRVLALAETEDPSAREALRAAVAGLPEVPEDWLWLPTVALLADACVQLGERHVAQEIARHLAPHRAEHVVVAHGVAWLGPIGPRLKALEQLTTVRTGTL